MSLWSRQPASKWAAVPWVQYLIDIELRWLRLWQESQLPVENVLIIGAAPAVSEFSHVPSTVVVDEVPRSATVCGSYAQLPFASHSFDWVIIQHAHESGMKSQEALLAEAMRVLKPEGILHLFSFRFFSLLRLQKLFQSVPWRWLQNRSIEDTLTSSGGVCAQQHALVHCPWGRQAWLRSAPTWEGFGAIFFPGLSAVRWQIWQKKTVVMTPKKLRLKSVVPLQEQG